MKSIRPVSAHWRSSKTRTTTPRSAIRSKSRRAAANVSLLAALGGWLETQERQEPRADRSALGLVRDDAPQGLPASLAWLVLGRRRSRRSRPTPDHLGQRPERDALRRRPATDPGASRRRATIPSMYFSSSQASRLLPIPAIPVTETSRARASSSTAWRRSLSSRSSASRPTNGGSSLARPVAGRRRSRHARSARQASTGLGLPAEGLAGRAAPRRSPRRSPAGSARRSGRFPARGRPPGGERRRSPGRRSPGRGRPRRRLPPLPRSSPRPARPASPAASPTAIAEPRRPAPGPTRTARSGSSS